MPINRKSARLNAITYFGQKVHFVTICCDQRRPHLANPAIAERVLSVLRQCAGKSAFLLHAYCAMPNHLHILVHGMQPAVNLLGFVRVFKSRTAFEFKKTGGRRLWEMSYYDHILRKSDDLGGVACYIWANPVRAGLCANTKEYLFSGSAIVDWMNAKKPDAEFMPPWKQPRPV